MKDWDCQSPIRTTKEDVDFYNSEVLPTLRGDQVVTITCNKCRQVGDTHFVSHSSIYGVQGVICQKCSDEEVSRKQQSIKI